MHWASLTHCQIPYSLQTRSSVNSFELVFCLFQDEYLVVAFQREHQEPPFKVSDLSRSPWSTSIPTELTILQKVKEPLAPGMCSRHSLIDKQMKVSPATRAISSFLYSIDCENYLTLGRAFEVGIT